MKKNLKTVVFGMLTCAALSAVSCKKENQLAEPLSSADLNKASGLGDLAILEFDGMKFAQNIENYMQGKVSGYGYAIYHEGMPYYIGNGGGGYSRKPQDAPATLHGAQVRQGIASSTKFVTALATISMLEQCGIGLNEKLYHYLPSNWKPTAEFKQLDFERLLSHSCGLINLGGDYAGLKRTVEDGVDMVRFNAKTRLYNNVNFTLAAFILPYVYAKKKSPLDYLALKSLEGNPTALYNGLGQRFIGIARVNVFKKAGLLHYGVMDWTTWNNNGPIHPSTGTLGYTTVSGAEKGTQKGDSRPNGGAGGLYISASEFAKIQLAASEGKIVSTAGYKAMRDRLLGFDGFRIGAHGRYTFKNGGANNHETMIFDFGKTQVAVFANSGTSEIGNDPMILVNAYDKAWVPK
jgi:CubicO group peptidase (beta-lactamase class C family)